MQVMLENIEMQKITCSYEQVISLQIKHFLSNFL